MPRYFFDTTDGDTDTDESGVELDSEDEAVREAIRFAGSLIQDQPDILAGGRDLAVSVRREGEKLPLARIRMQLIQAEERG